MKTSTGNCLLFLTCLGLLYQGAVAVECFSCVYIPDAPDSDSRCSAAWSWTRDKFPTLAAPPTEECEHACMKIVIANGRDDLTVVRNCGQPCNESQSLTTLTSCCETDQCNTAHAHSPVVHISLCYCIYCLLKNILFVFT